ncbi:NAD(P)/FAD-dependent oxidoreductase [Acidipila rosea]|uniref:Glycine/D-amino acid oxidase-like deaminating enzyme n=1 Tax=Acidipila rosea TaxID=768535 RepID=A0A4R1LDJ7_9BACT|nr:FAD-dependent oxidoreductase [Acidipila rosea]TCK75600.1 glycine/D-amino acid oxidase-like deaminating enzyme [Acidipila rosea]
MTQRYDAVVIGAGIVGAACARECAQAGMRTAIIEQGTIGGGATAAGMGHIVVMDDSPAQLALTRYSQLLWSDLASQLPPSAEYETCGTLWVAADEEEMAEVLRKQELYRSAGVPVEVLDQAQLREAEPNLRPGLAGALLIQSDAVLYPSAAALHLLNQAIEQGADLCAGAHVLHCGNGSLQLSDGTTFAADRIINAAGALAGALTPGLQIRKRKGHLVITDRYPGFVRHQLVELGYLKSAHSVSGDSVAFNVQPRKTGQILIGSSRQYDEESPGIESRILTAMLDRVGQYMPGIAELSAIRSWTGFRAATPDKLPLIGPDERDPTLFLATGHEGLGITTSLATARLLADHFRGAAPAIPLDPYLPSRFAAEAAHA